MSNKTFDVLWKDATVQILDQQDAENPSEQQLIPKDEESKLQHKQVLYVKYIQIYRNLEEAYDQLIHPQKRRLLRNLLTSVVGRVLELKFEMAGLEFSEFHQLDDVLMDLKLTPKDIELPIPRFFFDEAAKNLEDRDKILSEFNSRILDFKVRTVDEVIPVADAILLIQTNERGRQGCLRAKFIREIRNQAEREKLLEKTENEIDIVEAALKIQRVYRGFKVRKQAKEESTQEKLFLGMLPKLVTGRSNPLHRYRENAARRRLLCQQYEEEYQQSLIQIKEKISKNEGPDIRESIQDSFRKWYMDHKRETGKFPDFPEEEEWKNPNFKFGGAQVPEEVVEGEGSKSASKSGPQSASSAKKPAKGKDAADENQDVEAYKPTEFMEDMKKYNAEFMKTWMYNASDKENFSQKHDAEIVKYDKRKEVEAEIKDQIFQMLEEELANLKLTLEKDKGKKKKAKKDKKGKGKKGKKEKDITANRSLESLIEELATSGLFQRYIPVKLSDVIADHNYMGGFVYDASSRMIIEHSLMDVKRTLTEYCIFPIGFTFERESFPYVKSVLLTGASGCGKSMIVNAMATEVGASIFNISPRNTADSPFQGKSNVAKMMHMVWKIARTQKPAIIIIDNVEMVFAKKVPKDDTSDPKRIKKDLLKYLKGTKPEDRIVVIGMTNKPWDADKGLLSAFEKVVYIPPPNYGVRYSILTTAIRNRGIQIIPDTLNVGTIAKLTEGRSNGELIEIVNSVLTPRRVRMIKLKQICTEDFLRFIQPKEETAGINSEFKDWVEKLPSVKKRQAWLGVGQEGEPKKENAKGGKKK